MILLLFIFSFNWHNRIVTELLCLGRLWYCSWLSWKGSSMGLSSISFFKLLFQKLRWVKIFGFILLDLKPPVDWDIWDTLPEETLCLLVVPPQETKLYFLALQEIKNILPIWDITQFGHKIPVIISREIQYVLNHRGSLTDFYWFLIKQNRQTNTTNIVHSIRGLYLKSVFLYYTGFKRPLSRENLYFMKDPLCLYFTLYFTILAI